MITQLSKNYCRIYRTLDIFNLKKNYTSKNIKIFDLKNILLIFIISYFKISVRNRMRLISIFNNKITTSSISISIIYI